MAEETGGKPGSLDNILRMATKIVAAYVSKNPLPVVEVTKAIRAVCAVMAGLGQGQPEGLRSAIKPAVPISRSVTPDAIVCLEDGKRLKMLKRHLRTAYGLTPEQYRIKWRLPADYPMVAPNYAKQRSKFAKKIGLGKKPAR
jgi:predicted transcriptional regulator